MPDGPLNVKDFAASIKAQHPDYAEVDDYELTNRILAKYPDYKKALKPSVYDQTLLRANQLGIPTGLVHNLVGGESSWKPNVSDSVQGAEGLLQVMPDQPDGTTRTIGKKTYNLRDLNDNIEAGLQYLKEGYDRYNGDPERTAAYYFSGRNADHPDRWDRIADKTGTTVSQYVRKATRGIDSRAARIPPVYYPQNPDPTTRQLVPRTQQPPPANVPTDSTDTITPKPRALIPRGKVPTAEGTTEPFYVEVRDDGTEEVKLAPGANISLDEAKAIVAQRSAQQAQNVDLENSRADLSPEQRAEQSRQMQTYNQIDFANARAMEFMSAQHQALLNQRAAALRRRAAAQRQLQPRSEQPPAQPPPEPQPEKRAPTAQPTATPIAPGLAGFTAGVKGERPAAQPAPPPIRLTADDAAWHLGMTPDEWHGLSSKQKRKAADQLYAAVAEDQRKKDAGQEIQPPTLGYQNEIRAKAELKPIAFNANFPVQIGGPAGATITPTDPEKAVAPYYKPETATLGQSFGVPQRRELLKAAPTIAAQMHERIANGSDPVRESVMAQVIAEQAKVYDPDALAALATQPPDAINQEVDRRLDQIKAEQKFAQDNAAEIEKVKQKFLDQTSPGAGNRMFQGFGQFMAGNLVQAGNLLSLVGKGQNVVHAGRVTQHALQQLEQEDPDQGWLATAERAIPEVTGEASKLVLLARIPGVNRVMLPALGALSAKDKGTGEMLKSTAIGAAYQVGFGAIKGMKPLSKFGVATAVPAAIGIAQGEKPSKAIITALPFGIMAAGGPRAMVREGAERVIESESLPEWVREAAGKATGKRPAVVVNETGDRAASVYVDAKNNQIVREIKPDDPLIANRPTMKVSDAEFEKAIPRPVAPDTGTTPPESTPTTAINVGAERVAEQSAKVDRLNRARVEAQKRAQADPSDTKAAQEADVLQGQWETASAALEELKSGREPKPAQIATGPVVPTEEAPQPPPTEPPPVETAPTGQEIGRITPKQIIRHSDPNIDGGEVIGRAPDGRLKVQNKSGGISLVQDPRRQGNQEAAIVKEQEEKPAPTEIAPTQEPPKLPRELAGAQPRYSAGSKKLELTFENDVDRAAYIAAQVNPSKRDADYVKWAMDASGLDEAGVRQHGAKVRDQIKALAASASDGDTLSVPTIFGQEKGVTPTESGQAPIPATQPEQAVPTTLATQPGQAENVSRGQQETQPIREPRQPTGPTVSGKETEVSVPDSPQGFRARYAVREAQDVIPSHNPQNFQPNPDYYHVNDRRYESEPQYQMQVIDRSKPGTFDPRRVANNSPTVDVGPPVIDSDGNVLGGNSRAMILHRIYDAEDPSMRKAYRRELLDQAGMYGLDPQEIAKMQKPILVRELLDQHLPQAEAQQAITQLNRPSTTPLTIDERASAAAGQLSDAAADYITQQLENGGDDATVASVMNANGVAIINRLIEDGVFQPGERNTLIQNDKVTPEAKARVERMLVSGVYRDLKQMDQTPAIVRRNIERIVVPLNKTAGTEWDIGNEVKNAIDAVTDSRNSGLDLDKLARQGSLAREPYTNREIALAKILQLGPRKTAEKFRKYGNDFSMAASGGGLFGAPTKEESQRLHFGLEPEARTAAPPKPAPPSQPEKAEGPTARPLEKMPEPQWWIDRGAGIGTMNQADVLRASGMLDKGKSPRKWDSLSAEEQSALDKQWGRAPETPATGAISDAQAKVALSQLIESHPEELREVLANWDDTKLNEDGTLERHLGREGPQGGEDEFNTDAEIEPAEFVNWLLSDEALDPKQFGDDPDWRTQIETLRAATGLAEEREPSGKQWPTPNQNGVYSEEGAHKIEYQGKKALAQIVTLETPEGWIVTTNMEHHQGSVESHSGLLHVSSPRYATENEAIQAAVSEVIYRQTKIRDDTASNVIPKQREQAQKIIDWAAALRANLPSAPETQQPRLYHLAQSRNVAAIREGGLKESAAGELGPGVYLTDDPTYLTDKRFENATQLSVELAPKVKLLQVNQGPNYLLNVMRSLYDRAEATKVYDGLTPDQKRDPTLTAQDFAQKEGYQGIQLQGSQMAKNIVVFDAKNVRVMPETGGPSLPGAATLESEPEKAQTITSEQLPQRKGSEPGQSIPDTVGREGAPALETVPTEPVSRVGTEPGSDASTIAGAGQSEGSLRADGSERGGTVSGGRAGTEPVHLPATGERAGTEPENIQPVDHTIARADSDAVKPDRSVTDIVEGAQERVAENAEDSPTSHAVTLAGDYFISDAEEFSSGSLKQKYQRNIDALLTLRQIQSEGRERATPEEQATLARWIGWGQFPALMNEINDAGKEWATERQALKSLLSDEEWISAKASIKNAHYTAPQIVKMVWDAMRVLGFTRGRTLDPSMGAGVFFALMPRSIRKFSQIAGVELDKATGQIAKLLYPNADISIKGYEAYNVADDFFDLIISNFPFGQYQVADPRYPSRLKALVHDYFFVKSVDKARPGGLVVGITSTGTLDKQNTVVREHLADKADLVAAIRLPGNTFLKEAGTAVVTDLIILRKRIPGEDETEALKAIRANKWQNTVEVPDPLGHALMVVNEYYVQHPENIIGRLERSGSMYREDAQNVTRLDDFEDHLQRAIASFPEKVYSVAKLKQFEPQVIPAPEELKQGSYTLKDGKLFQKVGEHLHEQSPSKDALSRIEGLIGVRDVLNKLLYVELESPEEAPAARKELGKVYDAFVKHYGFVNSLANAKAFADDPDRYRIFALEKWDKKAKTATKTDVFTKPTRTRYERPTTASGIVDAVGIALNETGAVDIERIASLLNLAPGDVGPSLVSQGVAFNDPKGGWTTRETYLSGPVRQKLLEAEEAARVDPQYQPNVEALKGVQPEDVTHSKISARMGAPWIPASDIQQFMADMMERPVTNFSVRHDKTTGRWYIGYRTGANLAGSVKDREELGTPQRSFPEIIQAAIDDRPIKVTVKSGDVTYVDRKASAAANKKVKEVRKKFQNWIWKDDERRTRLHRQYNERYNDTIPLKVDGSHQTFPGMNELITLRDNQKNVVWRGVTQGRVMMAHEVGTGKTFSMIAMGMERRRLKLSRKPAIACLNTNVAQVTEAAHLLYPGARILAAHEGMTADTRQKTVTQIATGDWDLVILTHDNLDLIPLSQETQAKFIRKEVEDLKAAVIAAKREAGSDKAGNRAVKDLEKKLENRKAALANVVSKPKDDAITFEETGIDFLMVDESHKFKSLPVYTARGSVKGIPTSRSDRATNMYMRSQWLLERNNNQGLVFATGTPISNTLVELFNVQRFLQMPELEARGIDKFDSWAATFAESQTKLEYTPTGEWLPITRFSLFTNLADLSHLASQMMDVAFADEIEGLVRPKRKDHVITTPMSVDQKSYLQLIRARAGALAHAGRPQKGDDNWLVLTNDARKSAIDMRLIDRNYPDDPNSKLNRLINEVLAQQKEQPDRTQLIFSDMGINPTDKGISLYDDIIKKLVKGGIPREQIIDFSKFSPGSKSDQRNKAEGMERLSTGKAKIGIGGTEKLGTGVNVQQKLYNLHHLDAPYRPSDIEQRDGRGWRDQNENKEIRIGRYTTEASFDTQMWQILDTKNKFIRSFIRGDITARSMQEEDTEELSYAQIMATTSGNPLLIKKMELEADAAELESDFQVHQDQQFRLKDQIARARRENTWAEARIKNLTQDAQRYAEEADKDWSITVHGKTYTRDLAEEEVALKHDEELAEKNREAKEEVAKAKEAIAFYKNEAKEKGRLGKDQTKYAEAQAPKAAAIIAAFKKLVEGDVEMMPTTKIAQATTAFREAISKQIDAIKANYRLMADQREEGVSQPFGKYHGFDIVIVGDKPEDLSPALVGPSGEHHTFSWASARPGGVFESMDSRISGLQHDADNQQRHVEERTKQIAQLEPLADQPFAEMADLERMRKEIDLVTQELTASGAALPLPEEYSQLTSRYTSDGKLMPEESPIDVHEKSGSWISGEIGDQPVFRDHQMAMIGNPPGEVKPYETGWQDILDAHQPDTRIAPVAIEDLTDSVWFDNGMTVPLGYFDIIQANHPRAKYAVTNSRRFPNAIVILDGGKPVGWVDTEKPQKIDPDLDAAVRMVRERLASEIKAEAEAKKKADQLAAEATMPPASDVAASAGGAGGGAPSGKPPHEPPDPLLSDEDPEEAHAMAVSAGRMPMSDVPEPGFERSKVSASQVIKSYEAILTALGRPTPMRVGRIAQRSALGIYKPGPEVIRLRTANNIPTGAHEAGHGIQKVIYGATKARALAVPANVKRELVALGKALYGSRKPSGGYRTEGFAEFIRHYLTRDDAGTVAPNTLAFFESKVLADNPVLAEALQVAREKTDAYRNQGAQNRARANMQGAPTLRERIDRAIAAVRTVPDYMLDEFAPLFRLARRTEDIYGPLDAIDDPAKVASFLRGTASAKVEYMVQDGMLDFASNQVGPPLADAAAIVKGQQQRFTAYLWAKRAQERWNNGKNPGMSREDADAIVDQLETPEFELAAQKVYDWNAGVLEYVREAAPSLSGAIDKILSKSENYVPLARVFEPAETKASKAEGAGGNPLKRMKGSGRAVKDIFPQMIANAERMIAMAHKRRVLDTIVRLTEREGLGHLIEEVPRSKVPFSVSSDEVIERLIQQGAKMDFDDADIDELMTFFTPAQQPKGQDPIVPIMRDGVMRWYYVQPDLYNTLMGLDLYRLPKVLDLILGVPTRVFRAGTTGLRAAFALFTNPARDFQTFVMQTQSHKNPALLAAYWTRSMAAAFSPLRAVGKRDPYLDTFYRLGAQLGQPLGLDIALTRKTAKRLFRGKVINAVTDPLNLVREFLSLPESASRVAELRALANEVGWTPGNPMTTEQAIQLGLAAKQVTVDFSAAGRMGKVLNQAIPFFNANVQGGRSYARAMRDHPYRSILRGLLLISIPTLLLWWKNKDKPWYRDMPFRERYTAWYIEAGNQVMAIPRAFEWGNTFGVVPEAIFDSWYQKDPEGLKASVGYIFETTTPDIYPVVLRNAKEQWQNRIDFFDRPIVPRGELDLPPGEQRGPYTSTVAKWLGKKFPDTISPRRVDALIRGFGGGVAPDLLNAIGLGGQRGQRERELADLPVLGRAFRHGGTEGFGSRALTSFYDKLALANARAASKDRPESNDQRQFRLLLDDANQAVSILRAIQMETPSLPARQQISRLTREIVTTAQDTSLTDEARAKKLTALLDAEPDLSQKIGAAVEKKKADAKQERSERPKNRVEFKLPGEGQSRLRSRAPQAPSAP